MALKKRRTNRSDELGRKSPGNIHPDVRKVGADVKEVSRGIGLDNRVGTKFLHPDYALVVGNPARKTGWISRHGHVMRPGTDGALTCPESGFRYEEIDGVGLRCLDWSEDQPMRPALSKGAQGYKEFKQLSG
jgi:hypothetical protein